MKFSKLFNYQIIGLIIVLFLGSLLVTFPTSAEETVSEEEVKEKIKERLEKVVDEGLDKVKGIIEEEKAKKIYAYAGKIKSINNHNLTIETIFGNKQVEVATQAAILKIGPKKGRTTIEFEDLEIDQFTISMGPRGEKEVLMGKRLIVISEPSLALERKVLTGKVIEIDDKKVTFQINGESETIVISSKTDLKIVGIEDPAIEDIQIGDQIISIVTLDEDDQIDLVKAVLVRPGEANPAAVENEIEATPSASPS